MSKVTAFMGMLYRNIFVLPSLNITFFNLYVLSEDKLLFFYKKGRLPDTLYGKECQKKKHSRDSHTMNYF